MIKEVMKECIKSALVNYANSSEEVRKDITNLAVYEENKKLKEILDILKRNINVKTKIMWGQTRYYLTVIRDNPFEDIVIEIAKEQYNVLKEWLDD